MTTLIVFCFYTMWYGQLHLRILKATLNTVAIAKLSLCLVFVVKN